MKKTAILLTSLLIAFLTGCQDHVFEPPPSGTLQTLGAWRTGSTESDIPNYMARDSQGYLYLTGRQTVPFVAKYNSSGSQQWRNELKRVVDPSGQLIALDASGNIYVAGRGLGSRADFGQSGVDEVYLASYTNDGTLRWILSTSANTGKGSLHPLGFIADDAGNTYMTGWFSETVDFGGIELTSRAQADKIGGFEDGFLLKVNKDGALQWVRQLAGNRTDSGLDVALDQAGNVFVSGFTNSGSTFGGITVTGTTSFAIKYTPDGTRQWITAVRQASFGHGRHIGVDASGNSYVGTGAVVTKLNSGGEAEWHKGIPSASFYFNEANEDIAFNTDGDYYVTDTFSGTITIEGQTLTSRGGYDVFLVKYDKYGSLKWVVQEGGPQNETARKIVLGEGGVIHLLGYFEGTTTIAGTSLTSAGQTDIFVATYKE
ncbi:SBBP repeat-containing protein [Telluribacter sp. SYSU D00476]|uniref:SBBP repeat-containing protein n=1 Tax=Telluribacter sp. SYSU D00476 TaxID=2811430 RepID=UPI001FF5000E|nr:SBBP repeat-containing protein [Telluribacter sp. SYSU D00476]